jgi:hypothetical protein
MKKITLNFLSKSFITLLFLAVIGISANVNAATYYVKTNGSTAWGSLTGSPTIVELAAGNTITGFATINGSADGTSIYYFAPGTYNINFTFEITTGKVYGGFSGNETSTADLTTRVTSDLDLNGIVEPWEFTNVVTFTASVNNGSYSGGGTARATRLMTISGTGGEANGITLFDFYCKTTTAQDGVIVLGDLTLGNTAASYSGKLTQCIVRQIKNFASTTVPNHGIVMLTNASSTVDKCLIEDCRIPNGSGTVYMNKNGGTVSNSVIRNNYVLNNTNGGGYGGGIWLAGSPATTVDAIVSNCVVYNNTGANGGAIRGTANSTSSKGIQIINCTVVNNSSTAASPASSIELISSGLVANTISISDTRDELRAHAATNYVVSSIYGINPGFAIYPSTGNNNTSGITDLTFSALNFKRATTFQGFMGNSVDKAVGWTAEKVAEIKAANYQITSTSSLAHTTPSAILPASFKASGGSGADINITATVPTTDITGLTRTGSFTIGAYQATAEVTTGTTLTISNPATLVSVVVNSGGTLTVNPGKQLTVNTSFSNSGTLNLLSDGTNGTATILTPATIGGSGATYNVQQYLATARNWYMSSPISGATLLPSVDNGGLTFYAYPESDSRQQLGVEGSYTAGAVWNPISSGTMAYGVGYIVKPSVVASKITFTGTGLYSGDKTISGLTYTAANPKHGFNLIGNPYPSYVNVQTAINNSSLEKTVWYKTRDTNTTPLYHVETVNTTSGVGTNASGTGRVTGYMPPMQAFWVRATANNQSITLLNTDRSHGMTDVSMTGFPNTPTTALKAPKANVENYSLLGLNISNEISGDETILMFATGASNNLDAYDSQKMFNGSALIPEIFTVIGNNKLVINGMNSIPMDTEIPLGIICGQTNTYSIKASELKNFEAGTRIILRDKVNVVDYELNSNNAYTFNSDAINTTDRFSLLFRAPGVTTDIENTTKLNAQVFVNANNQITIIAPEKANYSIYNSMGQLIENGILNSRHETSNIKLAAGVYVVKVNNQTTRVVAP